MTVPRARADHSMKICWHCHHKVCCSVLTSLLCRLLEDAPRFFHFFLGILSSTAQDVDGLLLYLLLGFRLPHVEFNKVLLLLRVGYQESTSNGIYASHKHLLKSFAMAIFNSLPHLINFSKVHSISRVFWAQLCISSLNLSMLSISVSLASLGSFKDIRIA